MPTPDLFSRRSVHPFFTSRGLFPTMPDFALVMSSKRMLQAADDVSKKMGAGERRWFTTPSFEKFLEVSTIRVHRRKPDI